MKTTNHRGPHDHPSDLIFTYIEGLLPAEEASRIREHLKECPSCAREHQELHTIVSLLRKHKEALCPEPWELYELAHGRLGDDQRLRHHAAVCPSCNATVDRFRQEYASGFEMPERVREAYENRFSQTRSDADPPKTQSRVVYLVQWLRSRAYRKVIAVAAVAAAAMLAVVLYPTSEIEPMFALSSVAWHRPSGLVEKGMPFLTTKPRVAFLMVFRGIRTHITQEQIDAMYEGLRPTPEISDRVEVLEPMDVKTAIIGKGLRPEQRGALLQLISDDLGAAGMLFVEVRGHGAGFEVTGEFVDASTGKVVHKERVMVPGEAQLVAGMRTWLALIP